MLEYGISCPNNTAINYLKMLLEAQEAMGKSFAPKYGYLRDQNGLYLPDDKNRELICDVWTYA